MKLRTWLNIITVILLLSIIYFGWGDIVKAFGYMGRANLWILACLVPAQIFLYYSTGEQIFSYLRAKGDLKQTTPWQMARMSLELNFVNHILPSGGVAGFPYLGWSLKRHGVSAGRAAMSQIIRYLAFFISFVAVLLIAVLFLFFDNRVSQSMIYLSAILVLVLIVGMSLLVYVLSNRDRLVRFGQWLTKFVNGIVNKVTRGKKPKVLDLVTVEKFFHEIHQDYIEIMADKKILLKPFAWAIVQHIVDTILILIAFWALGFWVSPPIVFIAYGLSGFISNFSGTIGGTGAYEAIMVGFLLTSGIPADVAIAGTLLARVILVLGTVLFGFVFYQLTINKYGKVNNDTNI